MTPRQADAVTALLLLCLLAGVVLTAPRWAAVLRAPTLVVEADDSRPAKSAPAQPSPTPGAARRIHVRLYFEAAERRGLLSEEREVAFLPDLALQLRTVVEELAKGPQAPNLLPTLPPETRVLEVFVHAGGVVFLNLSGDVRSGLAGGSQTELLTVYSVVNTIVTNFPATTRVQILVDDQAVASLSGHVDLSRPLPPDMTLVALPPPAGSAEAPVAERRGAVTAASAAAPEGGRSGR